MMWAAGRKFDHAGWQGRKRVRMGKKFRDNQGRLRRKCETPGKGDLSLLSNKGKRGTGYL